MEEDGQMTDRDAVDFDWRYGENVAVYCPDCGTVFTVETDPSEIVGGTCQNCGESLKTEVR